MVIGRSPSKVEAVKNELGVDGYAADFARLDDVRQLAATLRENYPRIDVLANNAGGVFSPRTTTVDGHELTFQVNHLAPFLLTNLLLDLLITSEARVINTASAAHVAGKLDLADPEMGANWSSMRAYSTSKLCNILFTQGLSQRTTSRGILTVCFHPGVVASSFGSTGGRLVKAAYNLGLLKRFMVTPEQGADTLVWLATQPDFAIEPGGYYDKRLIAQTSPAARDQALVAGLWRYSAKAVGIPR